MSYHHSLGLLDPTPTQLFAQAVDPYSYRSHPDAVYAPYGWGPDFAYGMPVNYTHHLDYIRIPGARPVGPMFDRLSGCDPVTEYVATGKWPGLDAAATSLAQRLQLEPSDIVLPMHRRRAIVVAIDARISRRRVVPTQYRGFAVIAQQVMPTVPLDVSRAMSRGMGAGIFSESEGPYEGSGQRLAGLAGVLAVL